MRKTALKGFTLVELIIVMALLVILTVMVAAFTRPVEKLYNDTKEYSRTEQVSETVTNYVCERLKYATDVYVFRGDVQDSYLHDSAGNGFKTSDGWRCFYFDKNSAISYTSGVTSPRAYAGGLYRGFVADVDAWTGDLSLSSIDDFTTASTDSIIGGREFWGRDTYSFMFENPTVTFGTTPTMVGGKLTNVSAAKKLGITMYLLEKNPGSHHSDDFKQNILNYTTKYVELTNCEATITDIGVTAGSESDFEYGFASTGGSKAGEIYIVYKLPA